MKYVRTVLARQLQESSMHQNATALSLRCDEVPIHVELAFYFALFAIGWGEMCSPTEQKGGGGGGAGAGQCYCPWQGTSQRGWGARRRVNEHKYGPKIQCTT